MTKEELIAKLRAIAAVNIDEEDAHRRADDALLLFIHDTEIKEAYDAIHKWYS